VITIVDYGVGNLASIRNMLKKIGHDSLISSREADILEASKLILPGVGAFDTCSEKLRNSGLIQPVNKKVLDDKLPILGICVGCQLLLEGSEEGQLPGLGWIKGKTVKFKQADLPEGTKIPHMGWTDVSLARQSVLFEDMYPDPRFYFVHSYYPNPLAESDVLVYAQYGYRFVAGVERGNIAGVQFHPEKSHKFGMKLLSNFANHF